MKARRDILRRNLESGESFCARKFQFRITPGIIVGSVWNVTSDTFLSVANCVPKMGEVRQNKFFLTFPHTFLINLEGMYGKSPKALLSPISSKVAAKLAVIWYVMSPKVEVHPVKGRRDVLGRNFESGESLCGGKFQFDITRGIIVGWVWQLASDTFSSVANCVPKMSEVCQNKFFLTFPHTFLINLEGMYGKCPKILLSPNAFKVAAKLALLW